LDWVGFWFLDIDDEVAVAATTSGCRRVPVVEVEGSDSGEGSNDASSNLFELENLTVFALGIEEPSEGKRSKIWGREEKVTWHGGTHELGRRIENLE
jgi:hypothetical protein